MEKKRLNELKNTLYEQQRKMQMVQNELEEISSKNAALEQDFENEILKKNQNSKEVGQIINSINNISFICRTHQNNKKKANSKKLEHEDVKEDSKNLVDQLNKKLDGALKTVEELANVFREYGADYNQDKAYAENVYQEEEVQPNTRQGVGKQSRSKVEGKSNYDNISMKTTNKRDTGNLAKSQAK